MGLVDYLLEKVRGSKELPKKRKEDINLPDEKKGRVVAMTLDAARIAKGGSNKELLDASHKIRGGDPDDPRWDEHNKRVKGLFPAKAK